MTNDNQNRQYYIIIIIENRIFCKNNKIWTISKYPKNETISSYCLSFNVNFLRRQFIIKLLSIHVHWVLYPFKKVDKKLIEVVILFLLSAVKICTFQEKKMVEWNMKNCTSNATIWLCFHDAFYETFYNVHTAHIIYCSADKYSKVHARKNMNM